MASYHIEVRCPRRSEITFSIDSEREHSDVAFCSKCDKECFLDLDTDRQYTETGIDKIVGAEVEFACSKRIRKIKIDDIKD